jgi:hypothetical protein
MRISRKRKQEELQGSDSSIESITGASGLGLSNVASPPRRVAPTYYGSTMGASHDPNLHYQVQDEEGTVKTYFETHPHGNRKQRRYHRRHNPRFTKVATGGRDWQVLDRAKQKKAAEETDE